MQKQASSPTVSVTSPTYEEFERDMLKAMSNMTENMDKFTKKHKPSQLDRNQKVADIRLLRIVAWAATFALYTGFLYLLGPNWLYGLTIPLCVYAIREMGVFTAFMLCKGATKRLED